jgi:hypothetical protein
MNLANSSTKLPSLITALVLNGASNKNGLRRGVTYGGSDSSEVVGAFHLGRKGVEF